MHTNRKTAIIVGTLFIIGTSAGVLSGVITGPVLNGPDYLSKISANENQIITRAILVLIMGLALAMVPVMMFPIFVQEMVLAVWLITKGFNSTVPTSMFPERGQTQVV